VFRHLDLKTRTVSADCADRAQGGASPDNRSTFGGCKFLHLDWSF
jgi:hypothetical protein